MQLIILTSAVLAAIQSVSAHGSIKQPKPIMFDEKRGTYNAPLKPDYSDFPCKGYHTQPFNAAESWKAGEEASFTVDVSNIAAHGGGSCQASISHDGGKSFQVLHSFIGDCPRGVSGNSAGPDQVFKFMIPKDEPAGEAIFAWTWFAAIANREMYMNCAFVTIENNNGLSARSERPSMFVGSLAPGACKTDEGTNLEFPKPGNFVTDGTENPTAAYKTKTKPSGSDCGHAESGDGETIQNSLPPNSNIIGGPVGGPKPAPNVPVVDVSSSMMDSTSTIMITMTTTMMTSTTTMAADPMPSPPSNGGESPKVVVVYQTVTEAVIAVTTVTATEYGAPMPTNGTSNKKRSGDSADVAKRDSSCSFQETLKIGNACPVPSTKSSQWEGCVWDKFCPCLDDNLSPTDIVNFSQIKGHCDCVTKGIGCTTAARTRHRRRHIHRRSVDIVLNSQ